VTAFWILRWIISSLFMRYVVGRNGAVGQAICDCSVRTPYFIWELCVL